MGVFNNSISIKKLNKIFKGFDDEIGQLSIEVGNIETDIGEADISTIGDGTIKGAIVEVAEGGGGGSTPIDLPLGTKNINSSGYYTTDLNVSEILVVSARDASGAGVVYVPVPVSGKWWFYALGTEGGQIKVFSSRPGNIDISYYER